MTADEKMMTISFSETGEVNALHRDEFNLAFLGSQEIDRASDIRFDAETQRWGIHLRTKDGFVEQPPPHLAGFLSYDTARQFEVRFLEQCRMLSIDPLLPLSSALGSVMRKTSPADFLDSAKAA